MLSRGAFSSLNANNMNERVSQNITLAQGSLVGQSVPGGSAVKIHLQCRIYRRHRLHPWVGKVPWSRKWQPTSLFLPGKPREQRSLVGHSPQGCRIRHDLACAHAHVRAHTHTHTHTHMLLFTFQPTECTTPMVNPKVNYGRWMIMMSIQVHHL